MPRWLLVGLAMLLCAALPNPAMAAADYSEQELEQRLAEARQQLDEAAKELAELNRTKYRKYDKGSKKPSKAMLGIVIDDQGKNGGLRLHGLTPGGGAIEAGLKTGDVIVAVNGVDLGSKGKSPLGNLSKAMKPVVPGESVTVRYLRAGDENQAVIVTRGRNRDMKAMLSQLESKLDIDLDLEGLEASIAAAAEGVAMGAATLASIDDMGLHSARVIKLHQSKPRLVTVDKDLGGYFGVSEGALVIDCPNDAGDVLNGDVLLTLDGKPISDATVAHALLADAGDRKVPARIRRQGRERSAQLNAQAFNRTEKLVRTIRIESDGDDVDIIVEDDSKD